MPVDSSIEAIPFHRPFTGKEEEEALIRVLRSGWLTTGNEALSFENEFADFLTGGEDPAAGKIFCMAVNSATSGLHLALEALGVGPGDAVFLPSYTFTATAEVIRYLGAEAVFVDIAPDSCNIDPEKLEAAISALAKADSATTAAAQTTANMTAGGAGASLTAAPPITGRLRPKAVIPVHIGGLPCDMDAISGIAGKYGLAVVEDAAHAFPAPMPDSASAGLIGGVSAIPNSGAEPGGKRWAGTCGDAGVFSFYASKTITTGEGGMVVTRREDLARRISLMRNHGIDRPVWNRYTDTAASWYYEVTAPGFKYNLPDILATLGRVQLRRAVELLEMRLAIAERYDRAFSGSKALIIPPPGGARHLYSLRLREPAQRDHFIESLRKRGIGTSVHYIPLHIMPYYRKRYCLQPEDLPESYKRFKETVSLPIWPGMNEQQIERVIAAVEEAL